MSRLAFVLLAAMAWAGTATAQTQSTAPTAHAGTKLAFPASIGGAQLERSVNYAGPPSNRPDQGITYFYSTPKKMVIAVHVYDGGRRVPPGSANPLVVDEFMGELGTSEQQVKYGGYTHFERPSVPSTCTYGSVVFRCITYSAVNQSNARLYTKMMLTGFRDHFISIRIDWSQARQQTASDADAALQAFVPALFH
ncbi:hypothetical protein SAMN02990966_03237 [Rhodospirillales bacterium URHD0017]|nr:hypothetical protein SAMN02990966_03237 [Rhodospirillales bacterium URHD0017]